MSYTLRGNQPDPSTPNPWKTHSIKTVYENPWIEVSHREVTNPSGGPGIYGMVHFKNVAVGVIPLDDEGNTWLVGQYRYTLEQYSWEIPEGGGPLAVSPLSAGQRELAEETGMTAERWTPLLEMHLSNSVSDEYGVVFLAQKLTPGTAHPEDTEDLNVRKLPFSEVVEMVMRGEITDSLSVAGVLKLNELIRRGEVA